MRDVHINKIPTGYLVIFSENGKDVSYVSIENDECHKVVKDSDVVKIALNKLIRRREINNGNTKVAKMELYGHLRGRHKDATKGR